MNKDNMTLLGLGGALAAIGGLFWWKKKQEAPKPVAAAPTPQVMPQTAQAQRMPEVQVSPGPAQAPSYQDTPPEDWTQEQASQATSDAGNQARDALGKAFGF